MLKWIEVIGNNFKENVFNSVNGNFGGNGNNL
jgi:hypothetical protein